MVNIKVIALDFVGVFAKENDYPLEPKDRMLEEMFGRSPYNVDQSYFTWAAQEIGLPEEETRKRVVDIISKIYEIREPSIFAHFPGQKFILATNHLSLLKDWLDQHGFNQHFRGYCISGLIGAEKPSGQFFEFLIQMAKVEPAEILFVDDNNSYVEAAKNYGLMGLYFQSSSILSQELKKVIG